MSASTHPPGGAPEGIASTTTPQTSASEPGHRRAPSAPSIPTSYDDMDEEERNPPNPGPGTYSLAGDMNHQAGTGSIGVKGYGPLVSGAERLQRDVGGAGPGPGAYGEDVDRTFTSSRVDFSAPEHPSAPFAKATHRVEFKEDDDATPGPAHYATGAKPLGSGIPGKGIWTSDGHPRLGESGKTSSSPGPHHYESAPRRLGSGKPGVGHTAAFRAQSVEATEATARRYGVVAHGVAVPKTAPKVISTLRDAKNSQSSSSPRKPVLKPSEYRSLKWTPLDPSRVPVKPKATLGSPWKKTEPRDPGFGVEVSPCALVRRGPDHLGENMKTFTKGYYLKEYRIVDNVMAKELADLTMMVEEDDWFD